LVVVDTSLWNGSFGNLLRDSLATPIVGLPQQEPAFRLISISEYEFKNILRLHRNILRVALEDSLVDRNYMLGEKRDVWAKNQLVLSLTATDLEWLEAGILTFSTTIKEKFIGEDRNRMIKGYSKLASTTINSELESNFFLNIPVTNDFFIASKDEDYVWIRRETEHVSLGIQICRIPFVGDSMFTINNLIGLRDSVSRIYIPGPSEGSYMQTELKYPPVSASYMLDENYTFEVKGLWKTHGDFMGGPFTSYLIHDENRSDLILIDTFIFSPKFDKREYVRQLDAIIHGIKLK
jgi:hypothetical protein